MLRAENLQNEKIMSALEGLGLGGGELDAAEKYLKGEAGEEILAGITFRDMTQMPPEKPKAFDALFSSYLKKKRNEEASKLFNLVYAVGGSTSYVCFRYIYDFANAVRCDQLRVDRAKALAVYIQETENINNNHVHTATFRSAINTFAQSDPQIVLQAYNEYKGRYSNGRIILLTLYFYLRCGEEDLNVGADLQSKKAKKTVSASLKKLFGGKERSGNGMDDSQTVVVRALNLGEEILNSTDMELLRKYEELLVGNLGMLFIPDASREPQVCEIQKQIRQGGLTGADIAFKELGALRGRTVNENILRLLGAALISISCSLRNYALWSWSAPPLTPQRW